ncbi:MAG: site-specific DNA-methyltransferase [Turicibacter sp.]|nr:site-specific DNA-methyltransferase [Turicibacter sp.]
MIEGDNYEAQKVLQSTHKGMFDVIYIDPPYNTGKEFVYNDRIVGKEDSYRHSKWLSFISKRLDLAYNLLSYDGVIFISIDDNEMAQLKLLCDELFGEHNLISIMPRKTVEHIRKTANHELQNLHDYVFFYAKDKQNVVLSKEYIGDKEYPHCDEKGNYLIKPFQNSGENGTREARPNLYYPIYYNKDTGLLSLNETPDSIKILPKKVKGKDGRWLWSKEKFLKDNDRLTLFKGSIYKKEYEWESVERGKYRTFKTWLDLYQNRVGSAVLNNLNLGDKFSYPKPLELIKFLINLKKDDSLIVLDFFAGSGTTGHAVLELNQEDGGNRQFILCTNNENNICEEVTYERLKKVVEGYITPKGKVVEGIPSNLSYYKTKLVSKEGESWEN